MTKLSEQKLDATGARQGKVRRRVVTIAILVSLGLASGSFSALGALAADPAPNTYAGSYALFYDGAFAGPIHALSGCTPDINVIELRQNNGPGSSTTRAIKGQAKLASCQIEVGLGMSQPFRDAVTTAVAGDPKVANLAIARLNDAGTAVTSELDLRGYVSDVTLPTLRNHSESDPSWLRVELISRDGTAQKITNPGGRVLGSLQDDPIEAAKPTFALTDVDPTGLAEIDPIAITRPVIELRQNGQPGTVSTIFLPGRLGVLHPRLRVDEIPTTVNQLSSSFDAQLTSNSTSRKDLSISYRSTGGRNLFQLTLSGFPTHFDPYPRTDNQRVLEMGVDSQVKASWGASRPT